ncbi:MAG: HU family DNA-binding protein [Thermodesulfobacteriota bacterium]|nr:HU family DNA-binding protein [Thermodesulfobacteriota bacterium]
MNRVDLINALRDKTGINRRRVENIIDTFFGTITKTLSKGERVEIRGFGSFTAKKYKPYTGRNPKTGKQIKVRSKKLPFFKVGKELKDMVDD